MELTAVFCSVAMNNISLRSRRLHPAAFSLLELLVVMGVLSLLVSLLLPGLSAAREQAKAVACRSNIGQIMAANRYYAEEQGGMYCPGASDFLRNLHRWHGTRDYPSRPFTPEGGPLVPYLGREGGAGIRQCAAFPVGELVGGFERGNGGYGYNNAFIGVQVQRYPSGEWTVSDDRAGAPVAHVKRPGETLMFADCAFAGQRLIEYSFAEPRFQPSYPSFHADPSIHFRHRGQANVGWCDGHADPRRRTFTWSSRIYSADPDRLGIGWFGNADDNSLFDLD